MENEVQSSVPPIQLPQTPVPISTLSSSNWVKILLFTVLGLIIVAGSVFIGIQIDKNQTSSEQPITVQPTTNPTTSPIVDWKTYTNTKYMYQLQYPSTWLVQTMNGNEELVQSSVTNFRITTDKTPAESGFSLSVISNPTNLTLTDWIKQNPDNGTLLPGTDKISSSIYSVNGLGWEKINNDSIGYVPTGYVKYGLAHNGNLYYVVIYSADTNTLKSILSTFKFID